MGSAPQKVGRYEIVGELGKGAMGLVYKALDPMIGRTVAMKTMRMDVHGMESDEMLKRFQNEARAAGVLNHRNIVTIYDAGEQDGMFYIAMEFIEGVTLHSLITQNRVLPVEQIIDVSGQVLAGLDYAHSHGVIHRDVKPANIMIMPDKSVKIMDFGIAKAGGGLTSAGQVLGTPNYMSPEQVKGRTLDGRSDLFSFGVILYEMVTGEKPFTGQNVTTIIYKIVNENPIAPRELDVTIHPGLSAVISRALAKSPDERYQTGADLTKDLTNYKNLATTTPGSNAEIAAAALNAQGSDKTVAFDSQAMAKMGSGSMPATPSPAAPVAVATAPAAAKPLNPIDSTIGLARKKLEPAVAAAKKQPKGMLIGMVVLALVVIASGLGWMKHRANLQREAEQQQREVDGRQVEAQQKAQIEQQVKSAPTTQTATPDKPATETPKPKSGTPATKSATKPADKPQAGKPGTTQASATQPSPTPAAGTSATTGELLITTNPSGAQIQVDGAMQGTSPFTARNLTPGQHSVSVTKSGFQAVNRSIEVAAGKATPLVVTLTSAPTATLKLSSQPAGASIIVDEKDTGKVTPANLPVDLGSHKVVLRKQGFKDAAIGTPALTAGQSYDFAPLLQSGTDDAFGGFKKLFGGIPEGKGMANFHTDPKGAQVLMNGYSAPKLTPFKLPLDPGTYNVTFKLNGYKPVTQSVVIEKGKTADVQVKLQKQ